MKGRRETKAGPGRQRVRPQQNWEGTEMAAESSGAAPAAPPVNLGRDQVFALLMLFRASGLRIVFKKITGEDSDVVGADRAAREQLVNAILDEVIGGAAIPTKRRPRRDLSYFVRCRSADPVRYDVKKTEDGMHEKLQTKVAAVVAVAAKVTVGKVSGPDWRAAVDTRVPDYSRDPAYNRIEVIYEDMGTDPAKYKAREQRALRLERRLHKQFRGEDAWDETVSDHPGQYTKDENARMFVYVVYGPKNPPPEASEEK